MLYQHKTDFKKTYLYIEDKKVYDIHLTALISKLLLKILPFNILYCPKYWHCYVTILERLNYLLLSWKKRNFTEARTWYIQKSIKVSCWDELRLLHLLYFFHLDTEHKFNIQNFQNVFWTSCERLNYVLCPGDMSVRTDEWQSVNRWVTHLVRVQNFPKK